MTYSFFPPSADEQPLAWEPEVLRRFSWPRGTSVVRQQDGTGFENQRYVYPYKGWVEGIDYFVGGHHYSGIPDEIGTELISSGYGPELE